MVTTSPTPNAPAPGGPPPIVSSSAGDSKLLGRILLGFSIAAIVATMIAFIVAFFSEPPTAAKLSSVVLTPHPPTSKLNLWVAPPVARWESPQPLALRSYLANDSNNPILVGLNVAAGSECRPRMRMLRPMPETGREEALIVPAHDHAEAVVEVDVHTCADSIRNAGIPLQVHYAWHEPASAVPSAVSSLAPKTSSTTQPQLLAYDAVASTSPIVFPTDVQQGWSHWTRAFQAAYTLIKDLVWPLVLAALGFIFQQILARQSDERTAQKQIEEGQATERAREQEEEQTRRVEKQEQEQTRRAQRQQILTHLLPEYMALVQKHYLPIARRIQTVESEWTRYKAALESKSAAVVKASTIPNEAPQPKPPDAENPENKNPRPEDDSFARLLTAILLLRSRQLHLYNKKGGIFFRTSTGEEIFANCISEFTEKCQTLFGKDAFESAALSLDPESTHPDAIRKLFEHQEEEPSANGAPKPSPLPDMNGMLAKFQNWASDNSVMEMDLNLLRLCDKVLSFECDRIFYQTDPDQKMKPGATVNDASGWYFDAPQLAIDLPMLDLPDPIRIENKDKDVDSIYSKKRTYALLVRYLECVPDECKPNDLKIPSA